MSEHQAVLRLLGLARRAGELRVGSGAVLRAMQQERPGVVFLASGAGKDLVRKVERAAGKHRIERILEGEVLAEALGRQELSVVSVHDPNFVSGILNHLSDQG